MSSNIIQRNIIQLNPSQTKLVISGWGADAYETSVVEKITYNSDGLKVKGYIAYPKENSGRKFPCVIWNRGGYLNMGAIDHFTARGIFGSLASNGYVVFSTQYRGNDGGEGHEQLGGDDVNDVINLIPLAEELGFTDSSRWAIEGWSRGGMMTFLTLMKKPQFRCAILNGAISDLYSYVKANPNTEMIYKSVMNVKDFDLEVRKRSIINFVDKLPDIPYLLIHGGKDETIPVKQTLELAASFTERNLKYRLVVFEEGDHFLKNFREEVESLRNEWLSAYLKN